MSEKDREKERKRERKVERKGEIKRECVECTQTENILSFSPLYSLFPTKIYFK